MSRAFDLIVRAALLALALPVVVLAQSGAARITGVVKDSSGAVLPGVTVEAASDVLIEKVRTATTDGEGLASTAWIVAAGPNELTASIPAPFRVPASDPGNLRVENRAGRWATGYDFPAYESGAVVKREFTRDAGQPMQAFVLNTRHERFDDRRVRRALTYAFDFESLNRTQFYDFYSRTTSYFEGSELAATGLPEGLELEILQSLEADVPEEVFTEEFTLPVHDSPQATRQHLRRAVELFAEAGWTSQGGRLVNGDGEQFRALLAPFLDRSHVALLGRRAHEIPEYRAQRCLEGDCPVHPAVGVGALLEIHGPQRACAVLGREIAHDCMRLPEHEAAVVDCRHE